MATPGQLMDAISEVTGTNPATVESLYNQLRDANEIPRGARGKNALKITSDHAAKLVIAVCGSEQIKDAVGSVRRFSALDAVNMRRYPVGRDEIIGPYVIEGCQPLFDEFPKLAALGTHHNLFAALVALIDSYIEHGDRASQITISFGSPYPWAETFIMLEKRDDTEWKFGIMYRRPSYDDRDDDDPEFIALIDPAKERQRRRFSKLGGDLNVISKISHRTFEVLGNLLRD